MIAEQLPCTDGDVRVRQLRHDDAEAFARGTDDEAVKRYGHLPLPEYTPEIVRDQIDGVIADGLADGSLAVLAIADAESDEFLGSIVLFDFSTDRAEVGFWLAPWARGRGAAQHALRAIARAAAARGLSRLDARTVPENTGSRKVLEAGGFTQVGEPTVTTAPSGAELTSLAYTCSLSGAS
ncbi:GNAT family N-acetyltransferase [Nocardia donostiensis]|uniref:GNAT family N-acetyltransferase n=1 Tax=Nocardia donostiensis TaxID=1538463 RepID=A0A1V2TM99_9NOCA|nr:GNAT family protein [Nocardia donostiensis]ONM50644.1 GNAT family N-acetyltransferase [Nocardia donostiensis]OQS17129.1 GNAT family N-acetyltransferase [Nocardia donostiensis]OQS18054.1 GNAT family N-acetyltransferase [Nocardia donostiensis]